MAWNDKVWDLITNIYWTPRFIGLKSKNEPGSTRSWTRNLRADSLRKYLETQEEVLNHFFNITFAIAPYDVLSTILCSQFTFKDTGRFESYGQEFSCWRETENVTQPDGLFVSEYSIVATELKLNASSSVEQLAKYAGLMSCLEKHSQQKNLGLLYIVPERSTAALWKQIGFLQPEQRGQAAPCHLSRKCADRFLDKVPSKIRQTFEKKGLDLESALRRVEVAVVTWTWLRDKALEVEQERETDKTLQRLLQGFAAQIEAHRPTGIIKSTAAKA